MTLLLILSRAIHFGSCLLLLSIFAVRLLVEPSSTEDGGNARRLVGVCLLTAAGSAFVWFWIAVAEMNGSGLMESLSRPLIQMVLTQTPPGHVWIVRGAIGVLLALTLCFPPRPWTWSVGAGLSVSLVGSLAWLGHARASGNARFPLMLIGDVCHLVASGVWPAGLLPFGLLLMRQIKAGDFFAAYVAVKRFSSMSLVVVAVLVATGVINACFLVGSFHALTATPYGQLLIIKVALFAIALGLGSWNLLVHKPRLESVPEALEGMVRKVWMEVALGMLIILAVAMMGTMTAAMPPR